MHIQFLSLPLSFRSLSLSLGRRKVSIGAHPSKNTRPEFTRPYSEPYILFQFQIFLSLLSHPEKHPEEISSSGTSSILRNVASPPFSTEDADVISGTRIGSTWNNRVKISPLTSCTKTNCFSPAREIALLLSTYVSVSSKTYNRS